MRSPRTKRLWITCGLLWITCGFVVVPTGCGDDSSGEEVPGETRTPVENAASPAEPTGPVEPELEPLPEDLPEPDPQEQLEAACFSGDTEACDQLGH